jgi:hypothetical protein
MHYSACDHCNRLFVVRHRPSLPRPCPQCRRDLRPAEREEMLALYDAARPILPAIAPAIYEAVASLPLLTLDPADR